jgi:predicted RND superfamily exporter protein
MERLFRRPQLIVGVIGLITVFFALQLPRAQIDNNNLRFVPLQDEARQTSAYIDETFGSSLFILVGLERPYGTVLDPDFLQLIRDYVAAIEEIDAVGAINSLVSSDYITSADGAIVAEKLVPPDFSGTPEEIAALKHRILSWDMYQRTLVSDDWTATQVMVPLDVTADNAGDPEVVGSFIKIRDTARYMFEGQAEVFVAGMPVLSATVNEAVNADLILLIPLVVIVVLTVLFFSFRRITAVILPLLTVLIAVVWSVGAMPLLGVKLSILSTVLPVILVAVGSAYGIHVVTHYLEDRGAAAMDNARHRALIFALIRVIGKPVFLAALTTFAGFVSFCFTSVLPIREFGIFASFGVVVAFAVSVTLIPSLLLIRGPKPMPVLQRKPQGERIASTLLSDTLVAISQKRRTVLVLVALIVIVSLYGMSKVIIDNVMVEYFKSSTDVSLSDKFIREKFGGSKVVSVVVEAETAEVLLHPDSLRAIDDLSTFLMERVPNVGKIMGFTDLVKRINQVFNADEDPSGLQPVATVTDETSADGTFGMDTFGDFGSGDEAAGFGDFGFADEDDSFGFGDEYQVSGGFGFDSDGLDILVEETYSDDFGASAARGPAYSLQSYTAADLITLLDNASSAGIRGKNADDLVWEFKRLVNYEGAAYYELPWPPARYGKRTGEELSLLVSNYLALLSGSIDAYANNALEPTSIKTTVQLRTLGQIDTDQIIVEINNYVKANFPTNVRVIVGGSALVEGSINQLVVQSQLVSVLTSLLMVFLIVSISNKSALAGLISIVPLSISILINFAVMGFLGIKLNIGTSMVAAVSVGIGIDYIIHYLEAYKREYRLSGGTGDFIRRTFDTSGKAIIINAVSVGAGFGVLLLSQFVMLGDLGLLIALTMATSAIVSLTVVPVLLIVLKPRFVRTIP